MTAHGLRARTAGELFKKGAPRTINKTLSCLKMVLEYAEKKKLIQGTPKIGVERCSPVIEGSPYRFGKGGSIKIKPAR
jgi:hypothetical protein